MSHGKSAWLLLHTYSMPNMVVHGTPQCFGCFIIWFHGSFTIWCHGSSYAPRLHIWELCTLSPLPLFTVLLGSSLASYVHMSSHIDMWQLELHHGRE